MEKLKEINQLDNTLILFTSDNGPHYAKDGHELEFFDSNGQFKGGKRDLYEGGIRVPLIAYWDQNILPGSVSNHVSSFQDIMPTFSEIIGFEMFMILMEFHFYLPYFQKGKKNISF
ncbi:MAG: hypothetical protein CM15mP64_4270 [Candidatus Neomarinimicrobiota bacterium]|nr:MAG: hypothetical protein CM15mP64_4270 [Candidatus Neomarinimicrobiota bacterium]